MRALSALLAIAAVTATLTAVSGPSWLQHLGIDLDDTHLGKMGGDGPPPTNLREPTPPEDAEEAGAPFTVEGRDIYRFSCQSCHGPGGRGAPPEINSLLDPVRATSAALLEARQRKQGRRLPPDMARQLAADADKSLRDRIANGGKKMPAFPQLSENEVAALIEYLRALAGVPRAEPPAPPLKLSAAHVGEIIVKGTCHVCHPATGSSPSHMMMYMHGVIPSLASVAEQRTAAAVVAKVREGRMTMMGGGEGMMGSEGMMGGGMRGGRMMRGRGMMGRMGRMPIFVYLSDEEVRAAYLFLSEYTPESQ